MVCLTFTLTTTNSKASFLIGAGETGQVLEIKKMTRVTSINQKNWKKQMRKKRNRKEVLLEKLQKKKELAKGRTMNLSKYWKEWTFSRWAVKIAVGTDLYIFPSIILSDTSGCTTKIMNESHVSVGTDTKDLEQIVSQIAGTNTRRNRTH